MSDMNEIAEKQLRVKQEELREQDIRLNKLCFDYQEKEKQIQIDAAQIRALQKQNGELTNKVKELEAQIEKMKCLLEKWYKQHSDKTYTKTFYDELIKATEAFLWSDVCVK